MIINKKMFIALFLSLLSTHAVGAENCGSVFDTAYPPRDYVEAKIKGSLANVERRHFTDNVKNLIRGESTSEIMADLGYTLRKFPNHYPALESLIKYDLRLKGELPQGRSKHKQSVNCFFTRAFQFAPNDGRLRQLYGFYFHINSQYKQAIEQYRLAGMRMNSAELDYNIGLAYFKLGDLVQATEYAEKAYANNFPLPGLRDMLSKKGISLAKDADAKD